MQPTGPGPRGPDDEEGGQRFITIVLGATVSSAESGVSRQFDVMPHDGWQFGILESLQSGFR